MNGKKSVKAIRMEVAMDKKIDLWREEYNAGGIPSSTKDEPSGSVVTFIDFLKARGVSNGIALDLGCGKGRNSIYLAEQGFNVHSIDFVNEAINKLTDDSTALGLNDRIHGYCQSVVQEWPIEKSSIGVAIDAFCYKHQIDLNERAFYRAELDRVLKSGSFYLLTLAGVEDGYYGPLLESSPNPRGNVIVDPQNGIASVLYTKEDILTDFGRFLVLENYEHKWKKGTMHGKEYMRSTHVFIFKKI